MTFSFDPAARYRMPVMFGPTVGPRQGPEGEVFDGSEAPFSVTTVRFLSDAARLEALLPPGFALNGAPVVTVEHTILHDLAWLAGRSYSMLGVKLPVVFTGAEETLRGALLTVLWENRAEPILSGREELGFNKVYCELPEPLVVGDSRTCRASWDGFEFFRLRLSGLRPATPPAPVASDGVLHYAYMPPMGREEPHEARTRVMLSPTPARASRVELYQTGAAEIAFAPARFDQMPTMFQIVNVLADLPVLEIRGASVLKARGKGDLRDQRMVRQKGQG
ncbi:acetoacetate decarboxylase family protein [Pseudodonghicola flavimaris]|uniref:Acetoacetate decarboxylase family protein n=1 Tax=Pseudodonghicola flavimaris TaxID=3050036 RepID=A0ABT7F2H2_9RHOB|nr:acetoacetate decarboxylase family protein [Pseudodonghicola flavimaris]MDK3018817.1 acetoacetate decarboxylase family protein [Pseudodonghicola flavimaris]